MAQPVLSRIVELVIVGEESSILTAVLVEVAPVFLTSTWSRTEAPLEGLKTIPFQVLDSFAGRKVTGDSAVPSALRVPATSRVLTTIATPGSAFKVTPASTLTEPPV